MTAANPTGPAGAAGVPDRVGLGWRPELAAGILEHPAQIDLIEVIAEDAWHAPPKEAQALAELASWRPLWLHGVALGLASSSPVPRERLDRLARLVQRLRPQGWSEHLAFVRAGGVEIGHLAAPPRCEATVEGALSNLRRARQVVGSLPLLENIATLVEPPGSDRDEPAWVRQILDNAAASGLLDLHNLYANAVNFGRSPFELLHAMPLHRVRMVHIAGGCWLRRPGLAPRLLDDHRHAVPEPIYALLQALAQAVPQPLSVVLERDGDYPAFGLLLAELQQAREALARGRAARAAGGAGVDAPGVDTPSVDFAEAEAACRGRHAHAARAGPTAQTAQAAQAAQAAQERLAA